MERLKGLLVAGAVGIGVVGYNAFIDADRDSSGVIVEAGNVGAFDIRVGDCFNDTSASLSGADEVASVPAVPCADNHDNEVYAVFNISGDSYPGEDAVDSMAFDGCLDRFAPFVGRAYETSALDFFAMYPTRESWNQLGDREIVCAVYDLNLAQLEGSVKGLGL